MLFRVPALVLLLPLNILCRTPTPSCCKVGRAGTVLALCSRDWCPRNPSAASLNVKLRVDCLLGAEKSCTTLPLIRGSKSFGTLLTPATATSFCRAKAASWAAISFCTSATFWSLFRRENMANGLRNFVLRFSVFAVSGLLEGWEELWCVGTLMPAIVLAAPAVFGRVPTC